MKCPNCGKEIADDSKFCEFCGTKVEKVEKPAITPSPQSVSKKSHGYVWKLLCAMFALVLVIFIVSISTSSDSQPAAVSVESIESIEYEEVTPEVESSLSELEKKLCGPHVIGLQWLSNTGQLTIANHRESEGFYGTGSINSSEGYLKIEGYFNIQDENSISFKGTIEQSVSYIGDGQVGYRKGTYHFKSYYGRQYWRIREKTNPVEGGNVVDYIDIYF